MRQETRQKIRKMIGFMSAFVIALIAHTMIGVGLATTAFIFVAVLLIVDYAHNNPFNYPHMMAVFFWIFYLMPFSFNVEESKARIYKITSCVIMAAFVAIIPHLFRERYADKDKPGKGHNMKIPK